MRLTITFLVSLIVLVSACGASRFSSRDLVGSWVSDEGFSVELYQDRAYRFCDKEKCFKARYLRPGSAQGFAVELEGFFDHPETDRLRDRMKYLSVNPEERGGRIFPRLDFTITSENNQKNWCDSRACVLFGSVETEDHIIFLKR